MSNIEAILLMIVSIGAFLMPFFSRKLNLPSPVAEILFGLSIGIFFKDKIKETEVLNFLGELGFIILMYLAGLEINFESIKKTPLRKKFIYLFVVILIFIFSVLAIIYLKLNNAFILVILATAIGLLYPVLKDSKLISKPFGQSLLIIGSIGEVISLLSITVFFVIYKDGISLKALEHLLAVFLFFATIYLALSLFRLYIWWNPEKVNTFLKTNDITETSVRANFMNMFVFVAIANLLGLENIIGAFFGGMIFAMVFKERHEITEKLASLGYGFLIPIFFISVGLKFDITKFLNIEVLILALKLSILILIVRFFASFILIFAKFSIEEILATSFALSVPLTLLVAIATLGLDTKAFTEEVASSIIFTAIITGLFYPWIFKNIVKKFNLKEKNHV
ncbi:MAG TPA: cation:proton antiporter [Persephonella sp.]|nr:cation:proton antiporter [Hydrogenothermaceae bacterium]HIQ24904.1 cation:proton antiporter [Persephonella sp.]